MKELVGVVHKQFKLLVQNLKGSVVIYMPVLSVEVRGAGENIQRECKLRRRGNNFIARCGWSKRP